MHPPSFFSGCPTKIFFIGRKKFFLRRATKISSAEEMTACPQPISCINMQYLVAARRLFSHQHKCSDFWGTMMMSRGDYSGDCLLFPSRYSEGVTPNIFLKEEEKLRAVAKPTWSAISLMESWVSANS